MLFSLAASDQQLQLCCHEVDHVCSGNMCILCAHRVTLAVVLWHRKSAGRAEDEEETDVIHVIQCIHSGVTGADDEITFPDRLPAGQDNKVGHVHSALLLDCYHPIWVSLSVLFLTR